MELTAVIKALEKLNEPCLVTLTTDSKYVSDGISKGWARSWQKNGWKKADKKPALNSDLWQSLLELCDRHEVKIVWVKGHAGHPENERCDTLATGYIKRMRSSMTEKQRAAQCVEILKRFTLTRDVLSTQNPLLNSLWPHAFRLSAPTRG